MDLQMSISAGSDIFREVSLRWPREDSVEAQECGCLLPKLNKIDYQIQVKYRLISTHQPPATIANAWRI